MKTSISITLIVCGALLVLTPFLFNLAAMQMAADVMKSTSGNTHFSSDLSSVMQWAAFLAGLLMIGRGTVGAVKSK